MHIYTNPVQQIDAWHQFQFDQTAALYNGRALFQFLCHNQRLMLINRTSLIYIFSASFRI